MSARSIKKPPSNNRLDPRLVRPLNDAEALRLAQILFGIGQDLEVWGKARGESPWQKMEMIGGTWTANGSQING